MSVLKLPEPPSWTESGRRLASLRLLSVAYFALGSVFGGCALLRGDYVAAFANFGLELPFILVLVALHRVANGRTSLRVNVDSAGTTLRPDRTFSTLVLLTFSASIPLGLFILVFTLIDRLRMFGAFSGPFASLVLSAGLIVIALLGLLSVCRRKGVGYVKITSKGIDIADIFRTQSISWNSIVEVLDHAGSKKTRKAVVLKSSNGTEHTIDGADIYVPRGVGLYWMVRHYWRHPDDRAELTDGRAAQRLSVAQFDIG